MRSRDFVKTPFQKIVRCVVILWSRVCTMHRFLYDLMKDVCVSLAERGKKSGSCGHSEGVHRVSINVVCSTQGLDAAFTRVAIGV